MFNSYGPETKSGTDGTDGRNLKQCLPPGHFVPTAGDKKGTVKNIKSQTKLRWAPAPLGEWGHNYLSTLHIYIEDANVFSTYYPLFS